MKIVTKTIKQLKDGAQFKLSKRSKAVVYTLIRKWKGKATITSNSSTRSFVKEQSQVVYPV